MRRILKTIPLIALFFLAQGVKAGWEKQPTGSLAWLRTVHFVDSETGWIGGSNGTILTTLDGGKSWREARKFTSDTIKKIHFTNSQIGWVLCERDVYNLGSDAPSYLMRTRDGGRTWQKMDFEDSNRRRITNLVFADNGFGIALGEMGTIYGLSDDNRTWQKMTPPTRYLMLDAAFGDDFSGAIVGGGGTILFTEDGGVTWSSAAVSPKTDSMLKSVFFANARDGWTVGAKGKIYQSINGGKYWRLQRNRYGADLNGVYFTNNANGWAIGDQGMILHTTTGGNVWNLTQSRSRNNLEDIQFFDGQGWIVGFGGTLLKYEKDVTGERKPRLHR